MTISLSITHTPWRPERVAQLGLMRDAIFPMPKGSHFKVISTDYRGQRWYDVKHLWALETWRWHLSTDASHHVMMSDDLDIMGGFWRVADAMLTAAPNHAIGCMSNHPDGPALFAAGHSWYRCQAWLVGPCIIMPRGLLRPFVEWYEAWYPDLPDGEEEHQKGFYHDDSSINEWLSKTNRYSYHPLPAPIEHRLALGRSHDLSAFPKHAAEWISWRRVWLGNPARDRWEPVSPYQSTYYMGESGHWTAKGGPDAAPLLGVV